MKWPFLANDSTDRLREMRTRGGEGVQNPENFANVINGCPLTETQTFLYPRNIDIVDIPNLKMTTHAHRNSSHIQQAMGGSELDKAGRDALQPIHADN